VYLRHLQSDNENNKIERKEGKFPESRALPSKRGISLLQISSNRFPTMISTFSQRESITNPIPLLQNQPFPQIPLLY